MARVADILQLWIYIATRAGHELSLLTTAFIWLRIWYYVRTRWAHFLSVLYRNKQFIVTVKQGSLIHWREEFGSEDEHRGGAKDWHNVIGGDAGWGM